ncbi:MAG: neutral/alkaline non-lysosomal ceramidase N-terminal domain-containing protein, partial [Rhodothermales bacterium]|nr:neutral/alkaline non-lysosomal ceramidase N-terminal domain-containing protein [Rhodothermales bacterium]
MFVAVLRLKMVTWKAERFCALTFCFGLLLGAGCTGANLLSLPSPESPSRVPRDDGLHAGFGKTDITPPPGVPISGYGPEGWQSIGYRHRLYVRTLALEDAEGERVVISIADLPHVSLLLHRFVSDRLQRYGYGVGADRFMLSATHTHAGPGNFYEAEQYNSQAGALPGYDSLMVDFLVTRIAASVMTAIDSLQPARVSYGRIRVPNATVNRSPDAHRLTRDFGERDALAADIGLSEASEVDDNLYMLRVDNCDSDWTRCRPRGALSVFAIHGTGNPAANRLLDGGIHSVVERRLEEHIDTLQSDRLSGHTSFHLFANGAEGDVSPNFDPRTRCERYYRFQSDPGPSGHRRPRRPESWQIDPRSLTECLETARREVHRLGDLIGGYAVRLFDRLGTE